jgi:hypothetical protein
MNRNAGMPPARRRPMPGMATDDESDDSPQLATLSQTPVTGHAVSSVGSLETPATAQEPPTPSPARHQASDYSTTRLVNFRIPVDLHARYKRMVREIEEAYPRLRHPSLTELVIALLEEGPATSDQAASLIRRKRASEHGFDS